MTQISALTVLNEDEKMFQGEIARFAQQVIKPKVWMKRKPWILV
jgi:hypothetical protein